MLADAAPIAFIPSTDLARSRQFYEETLGQTVVAEDNFAVVLDVRGTPVRVVKVGDEFDPQPFTVFGWQVEDLDAEIAALTDRGVAFLRFEGMEQDEAGAWRAPGGTRVAWFQDPDGNTLSLSS